MAPKLHRRAFLRSAGFLGGAVLLAPRAAGALAGGHDGDPPRTGFEERAGASWTTHEEEVAFLTEVAARSGRVTVTEIGRSVSGDHPLHLVSIGAPAPRDAAAARLVPTTLFVCTQHGNEPAGREAGLQLLRDLAFTDDPQLVRLIRDQAILVVPTANPDGRARNIRTNGVVDINRDHLNLRQPETRAMHAVIRDWSPDLILDLHEYGPGTPVVYDAEILYLWPRNLNVDPGVQHLSRHLCEEYIGKGARDAGYTADVYGIRQVAGMQIDQVAGNEDEGICRNAVGLRHSLGILIESLTANSRNNPGEILSGAEQRLRRVASQTQTVDDTLRFLRDLGPLAKSASDNAAVNKARAGAEGTDPVYFRGADNDPPSPGDIDDPPPCRYDLTAGQAGDLAEVLALHGIASEVTGAGASISMGQAAQPVIPLLLDPRGQRRSTDGAAVYDCG